MRLSRFIGGILLIAGTSIGGGMLALPVVNATGGFWISSLVLVLCWSAMTTGAFFILEANLYLSPGAHMVSMARATLGTPGLVITWVAYLLLLYTLLCAYISGGGDLLGYLLEQANIHLSTHKTVPLFTLAFGLIVYQGIHSVDWINRALMFAKLGSFALLITLTSPYIRAPLLHHGHWTTMLPVLMVLITSFGFAIIVPNLRVYFQDNTTSLRRVIWIGSSIPLLCYIIWDLVIMGVVPTEKLIPLITAARPASGLAHTLGNALQQPFIQLLFRFFANICMLTAFLGVALCLISFLSDSLKTVQTGTSGFGLFLLTFLPPLGIVLFFPGIYLQALAYAGISCIILLLLLPACMVLWGRSRYPGTYRVPGGLLTPLSIVTIALLLLIQAIVNGI